MVRLKIKDLCRMQTATVSFKFGPGGMWQSNDLWHPSASQMHWGCSAPSALRDDEICCACLRLGVGCAAIQSSCENSPSSLLSSVTRCPVEADTALGQQEIEGSPQKRNQRFLTATRRQPIFGHQDPRHRWQTKLCRWAPRLPEEGEISQFGCAVLTDRSCCARSE
jgi:hypothetical protein